MRVVVVRGVAGPLAGVERRLAAGDAWTIGAPPLVDLRALGEGVLRVVPRADGVRLDGRALVDATSAELAQRPVTLELPGACSLELRTEDVTRSIAIPLALADASVEPAAIPRGVVPRPPRRRLRLARVALPLRISRALGVSMAVHAGLAVLLFVLLLALPKERVDRPRRVHVFFAPPSEAAAAPEDRRAGTDAPDELATTNAQRVLDADAPVGNALAGDTPAAAVPCGALLALRRGGRDAPLVSGDGDAAGQGALAAALDWLARHQGADGAWSADGFDDRCVDAPTCDGEGERAYPEAATALALLPFLGAAHTHVDPGPWRVTVRDGLGALLGMQRADGSFASDSKRAYASAIAAVALSEAYGLTGSATLREPAQRAATYFVARQSPTGGWRYSPGDGRADSSVTGWVTVALVAARRAGLDVPTETLTRCRRWFEAQTTDDGRVGYTGPGRSTDALLGVGLFCRSQLGGDDLAPIAARLAGRSPEWPRMPDEALGFGIADPMHWYTGSLGAFQAGGVTWEIWRPRLTGLLVENQRRGGCAGGSWDAIGSTGAHGGRVVTTALGALALEVAYRYPRASFGR